jgi:hypothetical protein
MNEDTLKSLQQRVNSWSIKEVSKWTEVKMSSNNGESVINAPRDMGEIYEEDTSTVAELIVSSKLNQIKLISTNKFLLRL